MTDIYSTPKSDLGQIDFSGYSDKELKRISNNWRHLKLVLYLFCIFSALPAVSLAVLLIVVPTDESNNFFGVSVVFGVLTAIYLLATYGTLSLKPWGRYLGIVVFGISLLSFPIGTLFGAIGLVAYSRLKQFFVPNGKEILLGVISEKSRRKT